MIATVPGGYAVSDPLAIAGTSYDLVVDVRVAESSGVWTLAARVPVQQTAYGVTPCSTVLGALRLRDAVEVALDAEVLTAVP